MKQIKLSASLPLGGEAALYNKPKINNERNELYGACA